ncbi:MAG: hypothetical protein JOY51_04895 [Nevskia sp.]|nr:hypothetical protein [Nevskia sp.]
MMNFKHKRGAACMLAAASYAAGAAAADYNTQIYSVKVDAENGLLQIEGVDLAPAGAPAGATVQLLGQTLSIHAAGSSSTHLEAALPEGLSLEPETGYQLYVSPDRERTATGTSPADQALFTLYVASKVEGKATMVVGGGHASSASAAASAPAGARSTSSTFFNSVGSAFSLNSHQSSNTTNGATTNNGSTFSLPYNGSLASASTLFSLTNSSTGDAIDGINSSTAANAVGILGELPSSAPGANAAGVRGINYGTNSNGFGVWGSHNGTGAGVYGTSALGYGVRGSSYGSSTYAVGVYASSNSGIGLLSYSNHNTAANFSTSTSNNAADVVVVSNAGTGRSLYLTDTNTSTTANVLYATGMSPGVSGDPTKGAVANFVVGNTGSVGAAVRGETTSIYGNEGAAGVYGVASGGSGYGGYFEITNSSEGYGTALYATTQGYGPVAQFVTGPSGNGYNTVSITDNGTAEALYAVTNGTGSVATLAASPTTNTATAVTVQHNGTGVALEVDSLNPNSTANVLNVVADGSNNAGVFSVNNSGSSGMGVYGQTNSSFGLGHGVPPSSGVFGLTTGDGSYAGYFENSNPNGGGGTLLATTNAQGSAGEFYTTNSTNSTPTIYANNQGSGPIMQINRNNGSSDVVWFQVGGTNVARIDAAGKGYFDGGTATSGADLAEYVPTIGATPQVGDVVEIDPKHPNSFRLCARANTTRVAGIISTAPGVTLNAKDGAQQPVAGPALALAGRVPTKVNNRNGAIHIGDLLVASNEPGHAMRAPRHPQPGTVIGKALQDNDAAEGTIEVLVMLR